MLSVSSKRRAVWAALLIATFATLSLSNVRADDARPFLHPLFTDNMVLQRGISDPVWGWTTPGQTVTVRIANKGAKAVAGPDGKWMVKLPPLPAGGPYTLTVSASQVVLHDNIATVTGPPTITLNNILVGDVWICAGQSNMDFGIGNSPDAATEISGANYPNIRLFTEGDTLAVEPQSLLQGHWDVCTPQTVAVGHWKGFSAVGYVFGRDVQNAVHIPIGLIQVSWGGTRVETWTSADANRAIPEIRPALDEFQKIVQAEKAGQTFDQIMEPWYAKHDPGSAAGKLWADPALDTSAWKPINLPGIWNSAGIPALAKYNGTVWFRKSFDLPAAWSGKDLTLHFGRIGERETTYVNGTKVGEAHWFWQDRVYTVPSALLKPSGNVIAVRDLGLGNSNGFADPAANMHLEPNGDAAAVPLTLAGPWQYQLGAMLPDDDPAPPFIQVDANQPTAVYNSSLAPLIPFGIKGALWYQGESSARLGVGKLYQTQLTALIKDWRGHWGEGDFPFLIVQLPNIGGTDLNTGDSGWAEVREAELLTVKRVPNTGLAVALGTSDGDLHPPNKLDTGHRLALAAEALVYGQKIEYSGPIYQSMKIEGNSIRLKFSHVGGGLVAKGGDKLTGFAIAGADGKFVWADAKIDGATVVVSSPTVPMPTTVRYAWGDGPVFNLYNQAGLPASPFRTDIGSEH